MENNIYKVLTTTALASALLISSQVSATVLGFTSNPTTNSVDWATEAANLGGTINSNVNFDAMTTGTLVSDFYSTSDGVTLTAVGDVNTVTFGTGPSQANTAATPLSDGEGPHPASNYLLDGRNPSDLIIDFAAPVLGGGLYTIDYFNPTGDNPLRLEAWSGVGGSGTLIGSVTSVAYNFQPDHLYFMGILSTLGDIRSLVFKDLNSMTGDIIGLDDILFATTVTVPAPSTTALFGFVLLAMGALRRRNTP